MYCNNHPSIGAIDTCSKCGKPICSLCKLEMDNKTMCRDCAAEIVKAKISEKTASETVATSTPVVENIAEEIKPVETTAKAVESKVEEAAVKVEAVKEPEKIEVKKEPKIEAPKVEPAIMAAATAPIGEIKKEAKPAETIKPMETPKPEPKPMETLKPEPKPMETPKPAEKPKIDPSVWKVKETTEAPKKEPEKIITPAAPTAPTTPVEEKNYWISLILSIIIPGAGQIYNGQIKKGIILLIAYFGILAVAFAIMLSVAVTAANVVCCTIPLIVIPLAILIYAAYDAYTTTKKINEGTPAVDWLS